MTRDEQAELGRLVRGLAENLARVLVQVDQVHAEIVRAHAESRAIYHRTWESTVTPDPDLDDVE